MRAELKRLHSPDINNLESFEPNEKDDFGFLLQLMIGPCDEPGIESFSVVVCSPDWLKKRHKASDVVLGRHFLIMFNYDYERLLHFLQEYCAQCIGDSWKEVAQKVGRLGKWEFEDYRETPD
jgi:hypothetical protein